MLSALGSCKAGVREEKHIPGIMSVQLRRCIHDQFINSIVLRLQIEFKKVILGPPDEVLTSPKE